MIASMPALSRTAMADGQAAVVSARHGVADCGGAAISTAAIAQPPPSLIATTAHDEQIKAPIRIEVGQRDISIVTTFTELSP